MKNLLVTYCGLNLLAVAIISCSSSPVSVEVDEHIPGQIVTEGIEVEASFGKKEGDLKAYLDSAIVFPQDAKANRLENRVRMVFLINEDGSVTDIEPEDKADKALIEEAKRVISEMPAWNPAQKNAYAVATWNTATLLFTRSKKHIAEKGEPGERKWVFEPFDRSSSGSGYRPRNNYNSTSDEASQLDIIDGYFEDEHGRIYLEPEFTASYPGGRTKALAYIQSTIEYPYKALENQTEGTVEVIALVDEEGRVEDCEVITHQLHGLDGEALRIVRSMNNWTPAMHEGAYVRSVVYVPDCFPIGLALTYIQLDYSFRENPFPHTCLRFFDAP